MDFTLSNKKNIFTNLIVFEPIGYHNKILRIKKNPQNLSKEKFDGGWRATKHIPEKRICYSAGFSKNLKVIYSIPFYCFQAEHWRDIAPLLHG